MYQPRFMQAASYFYTLNRAFTAEDIIKHVFPRMTIGDAIAVLERIISARNNFDVVVTATDKGHDRVKKIRVLRIKSTELPKADLSTMHDPRETMTKAQKIALGLK